MVTDKTDAPSKEEIKKGEDELNPGPSEVNDDGTDTTFGVPYQRAGQIRQALAEFRNAQGHGNEERQRAARKHLDALGYELKVDKNKDAKEGEQVDARRQAPEGRSVSPPSTVRTDIPAPATSTKPAETPPRGTSSR